MTRRRRTVAVLAVAIATQAGSPCHAEAYRLPALESIWGDRLEAPDTVPRAVIAIEFDGGDSLTDTVRASLAASAIGQRDTPALRDRIRERIDRFYQREAQMPGSGVVGVDRVARAEGEVLRVRIVEARLGRIDVQGLETLSPAYPSTVLAPLHDEPLRFVRLDRVLRALQADPHFAAISGRLVPTPTQGVVDLDLELVEAPGEYLRWRIDNQRPPGVGAEQVQVEVGSHGFNARGDAIQARVSGSDGGGNGYGLAYELPVNGPRAVLFGDYQQDDSALIEAPFDVLDIAARSESWSLGARWWSVEDAVRERTLTVRLGHRESRTELLGRPFSFAPGVNDGVSAVTTVSMSRQDVWRWRDRALSVLGELGVGVDAFGATINADETDGRFTVLKGAVAYTQVLNEAWRLQSGFDVQLADQVLLPSEKYAVGGADSVRGFRQNRLVRDNGARLSVALGRNLETPAAIPGRFVGHMFADAGHAWNRSGGSLGADTLVGLGVGLSWDYQRRLGARLQLAHAVSGAPEQATDPQDRGVHFAVYGAWQ